MVFYFLLILCYSIDSECINQKSNIQDNQLKGKIYFNLKMKLIVFFKIWKIFQTK